MSIQGKIDTYELSIETPSVHTNYKRVIYCKGGFGLAFLYFVPEDQPLGTNEQRSGENVFDVYYRMRDWAAIVDTLRNEKPVWFFFDDYKNGIIRTGSEEVGEEEAE